MRGRHHLSIQPLFLPAILAIQSKPSIRLVPDIQSHFLVDLSLSIHISPIPPASIYLQDAASSAPSRSFSQDPKSSSLLHFCPASGCFHHHALLSTPHGLIHHHYACQLCPLAFRECFSRSDMVPSNLLGYFQPQQCHQWHRHLWFHL